MTKRKPIGALLIILFTTLLAAPLTEGQTSAQSAITIAKNTIQTCYQAVLAAEAAGANVDSLMITLNQAANQLSQAELAYATGDYDAAYSYASQSQTTLNGFTDQASTLQQNATAAKSAESASDTQWLLVSLVLFTSGVSTWFILNRRERRSTHGTPAI